MPLMTKCQIVRYFKVGENKPTIPMWKTVNVKYVLPFEPDKDEVRCANCHGSITLHYALENKIPVEHATHVNEKDALNCNTNLEDRFLSQFPIDANTPEYEGAVNVF